MNRREFLTGIVSQILPPKSDDPMTRIAELEAALKNQGEASFMRDEALLRLISELKRKDLGITYYGMILEDFAKGQRDTR